MTPAAPLVGIPADFRILAGTGVHIVDDPYLRVVSGPVGAVPLILPALAEDQDWPALLKSLRTVGEDVRTGKSDEVIASGAGASGIQ